MTAPAVTPRQQYVADGTVGPLVIPWPFYDDDDLLVYAGETQQERVTNYTLTGAGEATGGELIWVSGRQPSTSVVVTIIRQQVSQRDSDLPTGGAWRAKVVNANLDYVISGLQDLLFNAGLAIRVSPVEGSGLEIPAAMTRANKHLAFDGSGEIILTSDVPVSDIKRTDPPLTLVDATAAYALPAEVQSGLDEDNYAAWLVGGGNLVPGDEFTVTADTITLTTTPTTANGLAGQELMVELVRPAINASAIQAGTVNTSALADLAVTSPKISITGQSYGDLISRDNSSTWVRLPAPTTDGAHFLGMDVSGSGTVKTFAYRNKALLNAVDAPALNSTPAVITNTLADTDLKMTITQGDEILTKDVTIDSDTYGIKIDVSVLAAAPSPQTIRIGLFRAGTTDAIAEDRRKMNDGYSKRLAINYFATGVSSGAVTYSVRVSCTSSAGLLNQDYPGAGRKGGGNVGSSMVIMQVGSKT